MVPLSYTAESKMHAQAINVVENGEPLTVVAAEERDASGVVINVQLIHFYSMGNLLVVANDTSWSLYRNCEHPLIGVEGGLCIDGSWPSECWTSYTDAASVIKADVSGHMTMPTIVPAAGLEY